MKNKIFTLLLLFAAYTSQATVVYVDSSSTASVPTGTSWATAYPQLDMALSNVSPGDTVWVAKGTYNPVFSGIQRSNTFNLGSLTVYGGFVGNETSPSQRNIKANPTILSGDFNGNDTGPLSLNNSTFNDNVYTVVTIVHVNLPTLVDGFTIEGGYSITSSAGPGRYGGGLYISGAVGTLNSNLVVRNCLIRNNVAHAASAIAVRETENGVNGDLEVHIDQCELSNNYATGYVVSSWADKTKIILDMTNCLVAKNIAANDYGLFANFWYNNTDMEFNMLNCTVVDNISQSLTNTRGIVNYHGFSLNRGLSIQLANNIFVSNDCKPIIGRYSGTAQDCSVVIIERNIFEDSNYNYAALLWNHDTANIHYTSQGASLKFMDSLNGDYRLAYCSDAVDAGIDTAYDPNATIYNYFNTTNSDLDQNTRIINNLPDLGCYENQGTIFDLNFNGTDLTATTGFQNYSWKRNGTAISGAITDSYTPTQNGKYEVTAEDDAGCSFTATYNLNNLSVETFASANLKMYPNPVLNLLHIDGDVSEINIYDLSGKLLIKSVNKEINVATLAKGIYILKATKGAQHYQAKFVKE